MSTMNPTHGVCFFCGKEGQIVVKVNGTELEKWLCLKKDVENDGNKQFCFRCLADGEAELVQREKERLEAEQREQDAIAIRVSPADEGSVEDGGSDDADVLDLNTPRGGIFDEIGESNDTCTSYESLVSPPSTVPSPSNVSTGSRPTASTSTQYSPQPSPSPSPSPSPPPPVVVVVAAVAPPPAPASRSPSASR